MADDEYKDPFWLRWLGGESKRSREVREKKEQQRLMKEEEEEKKMNPRIRFLEWTDYDKEDQDWPKGGGNMAEAFFYYKDLDNVEFYFDKEHKCLVAVEKRYFPNRKTLHVETPMPVCRDYEVDGANIRCFPNKKTGKVRVWLPFARPKPRTLMGKSVGYHRGPYSYHPSHGEQYIMSP